MSFFTHISALSILFPLITGFLFYKKHLRQQRVLFFYVLLGTVTELLLFMLGKSNVNNKPVVHVYTILEFAILAAYFKIIFGEEGVILPAKLLILGFLIFFIFNFIYYESFFAFNNFSRIPGALVLIFLSCYYLYLFGNNFQVPSITAYPAFWGSVAILVYFAGTIFLYVDSKFFMKNNLEAQQAVWNIHSFFNICLNFLLGRALWKPLKI